LPEGTASPIRTKNIALETNKRKELNDKLLALREAVPKISKVTQNFIYLFIYLFIYFVTGSLELDIFSWKEDMNAG
jgi:hypothetical protein